KLVDINAVVSDGSDGPQLGATFAFVSSVLDEADVRRLADLWVQALEALASHVASPAAGGLTPSDLPLVSLSQSDIEVFEGRFPALSDVWPLAPLQSGLLFHAMLAEQSVDMYAI